MTDDQLTQFMKKHRDSTGIYSLPVDGWEKLSKDERERLASRLKSKGRVISLHSEPSSQPLDLDDLDARLRQVPPNEQNERWKDFRKWQKDNRGLEDENDTYDAHVKEATFWAKRIKLDWARADFEDKLKRNPLCLEAEWRYEMKARNRQRLRCRERDCNGFADYFEAVKRRLASHGMARPFEFKEDPTQQDQLTTWIEYLGYEYWCLDEHAGDMERLAPKHDEAWKRLVDAKIVGPHETIDDIRSMRGSLQRENDAQQAHTEVRTAKAEAQRVFDLTQESPERFLIPEKQRVEMLNKVSRDVERAERRHKRVKVRNDKVSAFVSGTHEYARAKMKWTCHSLYVQWVLKQLPLVEAEMAQAEAEKSHASQNRGKKRMLSPQEKSPAGPSQKRQKMAQGSLSPADGNLNKPAEGTAQRKEKAQSSRPTKAARKRSCRSADASSLPPGGLRRSARIAARQPPAQPEPRQLRPRPTKKPTRKSETSTGVKGKKGGGVGKKKSGIKTRSKTSRR
ncbi:hypothetical protein NCS57_00442900 [Fusarium keratoplasticum]|uniref:Uncharacterized protein n=1 Tax=Fusarium keratoplasticum TaxID=1328300 RepID=A0ACC0R5P3_9HYPO|nr:hypothetical protein NCS57_00442900 [Fusarium keratoplasticum]KAI8675418.1 hypothetical protein NCS57_00442900 [Fusarium keratoplasticum]